MTKSIEVFAPENVFTCIREYTVMQALTLVGCEESGYVFHLIKPEMSVYYAPQGSLVRLV